MDHSYIIRYGLTRHVGRFSGPERFKRGETVVVRSHRGTELGEVLAEALGSSQDATASLPNPARILRGATPDDFARAGQADRDRADRFDRCRRVFQDGLWPLELIDVEPLLDDRRTVLHYLGPHRLDASGLLAALRGTCALDVVLEPVGRDLPDVEEPVAPSCGDCGSGGCGTGGGCGSDSSSSSGGCADCGVKKLLKTRRPAPVH